MRKITFLFLWMLLAGIMASAQNYQPIFSNRIAYFQDSNGDVKCIRIDSTSVKNDSVFYPFYELQEKSDYGCFTPYHASWVGAKVVSQNSGKVYFFNQEKDTIVLHTNAKPGDKWIAYINSDSLFVEASLVSNDTMSFLGLTDSVKTITFQAYDKNQVAQDMNLNSYSVLISKQYGLVKTLNFYLFPNFESYHLYQSYLSEFTLVGLTNPEVGIKNLTWLEVYDFQPEDEMHIKKVDEEWYDIQYISNTTTNTILKYLERTNYPDSVVYDCERTIGVEKTIGESVTYTSTKDTLHLVYKPDSLFDKLPGEPVFEEWVLSSYFMGNTEVVSKTEPSEAMKFYSDGDSCWSLLTADGCLPSYTYLKGLGGPYYECSSFYTGGGEKRSLVYYKKGDVSWGTPLEIPDALNDVNCTTIKLYPNPANSIVDVEVDANIYTNAMISFYNVQGQLVKSITLMASVTQVDIVDLPVGIYIVKIADDRTVYQVDRLLIEK